MVNEGERGQVLDGRFELVEPLGGEDEGGRWRGRDIALRREVTIRRIRLDGSDAAQGSEPRALREARALAGLSHPHVETVLHIVQEPGDPVLWVVTELVAGRTLADRLADGPLTASETAALGRQLLSALRAAHAAGLTHGDIRPARVVPHPDGSVVLTGFLGSGADDADSPTGPRAPEYLAPERIRGGEPGPAADLWSLGVLLYVCVEGHHPLRRATPMATLAAVLDGAPPPPARAGALGPALRALLVQDPAARPSGERLDALLATATTAGPPLPLPPPPPPFAPPPPAPRRPFGPVAVAVTAVVAVVVAFSAYALLRSSDDDDADGGDDRARSTPSGNDTAPSAGATDPPPDDEADALVIDGVRTLAPDVYRHGLGETSEPVPYEPSAGGRTALSVTVDQIETGRHADLDGLMDPIQSEGLKPVYLRVTLTNLGGETMTLTSSMWVGNLGTFGVFDEDTIPIANNVYAFAIEGEPGESTARPDDRHLPVGQSADSWVVAAIPEDDEPSLVYWQPDWDPMANGWLLWETS
ncbi:serine/threonine-protein kinase [Streptomyces profundus]|uniref:serine/threonine-protein kinase n=1 Tax=Streptomyces profundus TaxID=2867410 RepID=UPI001D16C79F|nr:serine/threonine-protein kinase [Streptomyces sp. MA3_2.13]UED87950.1 serine/threonine protein kinase [Streptomyces sp. MA3_2.13]